MAFGMSGRFFHAPFIATHPGFSLHGIMERSVKQAATIYPGIREYNDMESLLRDPETELVIVNTPTCTHAEFAQAALENGKHVLMEKSFALSKKEAEVLFETAEKNGRHLLAYQNRRWDGDFLALRETIDKGLLGDITELHIRYDRYSIPVKTGVPKEKDIPGNGVAYGLGPHLLDQAICLFGEPQQVNAIRAIKRPGSLVDDYAFFHLIFPGPINVFLYTSLIVPDTLPAFVAHGVNGSFVGYRTDPQERQLMAGMLPTDAQFGITESDLKTTLTDSNKIKTHLPFVRGNYNLLFDAVYEQIRNNRPYPIKKEEILWQMECFDQVKTV